MFNIIRYETTQFLRQPKWLILFIGSIIISIVLPRSNLTDFHNFPYMIYFVMSINLLFLFFGSEEARLEKKNHLIEQLKVLPFYNKFILSKLLNWAVLAFVYYLIFYTSIILFIVFTTSENLTIHMFQKTFLYTFMVWFIPFYFSILIGYIIYTLIPNIISYIFIVLVWFLIMPYNSMLGFIPPNIGAWFINGDPNIRKVLSIYGLESMEINKGYYVQRSFMLLLLISLLALLRLNLSNRLKSTGFIVLLFSLAIPFFSPYVPQIDNEERSYAANNMYILKGEANYDFFNYNLDNYDFNIEHTGNMHELRYVVKVDIKSKQENVQFALWDTFNVSDVKFNGKSLEHNHKDNLISLVLPATEGQLTMSIATELYASIGPTTFELIGTTPWYPMNPLEAANPYNGGKKENYKIYLKNESAIFSNLNKIDNGTWQGKVFGPTLLKGDYIVKDNNVYPNFKNEAEIELNKERLYKEIDKVNEKFDTEKVLSCKTFIFTNTHSTF